MDGEKDPDELFKKAKKKLDPGFFKSIFSDTVHRYEKAITYFNEAAEIYKLKKEWIKAGDSFIEVAKLKELLNYVPGDMYRKLEEEIEDFLFEHVLQLSEFWCSKYYKVGFADGLNVKKDIEKNLEDIANGKDE